MHWLLALLLITMLVLGKVVDEMERRGAFELLRSLHMNLGLLVLMLGLDRIRRRLRYGFPAPLPGSGRRELAAARAVHWALLLGTVLMPLSGLVMAVARRVPIELLGLIPLPRLSERIGWLGSGASLAHELTAILLVSAILGHAGVALWHHLVLRDQLLRRMLP